MTKIYYDFREIYWWDCLERNITDFLSKCPNCQQVKAEHQRQGVLTQVIYVPTLKWDDINMDFVVDLPMILKGYC